MFDRLSKKNKYIVAFSGGSDSVYLLYMLLTHGFKNIIAVHINHNIRKNSIDDEMFCKKILGRLKVKSIFLSINFYKLKKQYKKSVGIEELARKKRYELLEKIRKKENADFIITAHHMDDNIETIFLNILRGCGLNGLRGLQYQNNYILRPLLNISKKKIIDECKKNKWQYIEDESNFDIKYSRNYLRHKIIPLFNNIQNYKSENIINLSNRVGEVIDFIQDLINKMYDDVCISKYIFDYKKFLDYPFFLQKEFVFYLYEKFYGNRFNLYIEHVNQILNIIHKNVSNVKKEFGSRYWIMIEKKEINKKLIKVISIKKRKSGL